MEPDGLSSDKRSARHRHGGPHADGPPGRPRGLPAEPSRTGSPEERSRLMRFGIFGSAQARRGVPDVDSGAGFKDFVEYNVQAEALGYQSSFVVEHHFTGFGESVQLLIRAWTSDVPWSHRGKYWQFENVVVEPPTAQKPHPPLWMGAGRPESIKKVAARGYNLLLDQFAPFDQTIDRFKLFRSEVQALGRRFDPSRVAVARSVNVVMTAAEREKAIEARLAARRRTERLAQRPDGQNKASIMSYASTLEAAEAGTLYGSPDEIAAKLQTLRAAGVEYVPPNSL